MSEKNFIERHRERYREIIDTVERILMKNVIPSFIISILSLKKMAKIFGYKSISAFLKEDDEVLSEKFESLDQETQDRLYDMYKNVDVQLEGVENICDEGINQLSEAEIVSNVLDALDPEWENSDEDTDDSAVENFLSSELGEFFNELTELTDDDE